MKQAYSNRGAGHYCDALGCNVVEPCQVRSCSFNFKSDDNLNCLLKYKSDNGDPELRLSDCIGVIGSNDREVRRKIETVFNHVREEMLKQTLLAEKANRFDFVQHSDVCVNCGNISINKKYPVENLNLRWCSRDCKAAKPQWCIELEHNYRTDIRTLLFHARNVFKHLTLISSLFQVRRTTLLDLYFEYFGIKPSKFGLEAVDNVDLLRNPKQDNLWIHDFTARPLGARDVKNKYTKLEQLCDKLIRTL